MLELRSFASDDMRAKVALLMTLPPLLWAGNAVVGRLMVGKVPPLTLNFLRWTLVALLLAAVAGRVLARPRELIDRWPALLLMGTLGVGAYNALQYMALVTSTPINVTLIAASMPLWMLAIGALVYGRRPRPLQIVGALCSLAGVLLVISRGRLDALAAVHFVPGDFYIVVAVICWALYSWMLVEPPAGLDEGRRPAWHWLEFQLVLTLFGLIGAGTAAGLEQAAGASPIVWDGAVIAALIYVAIGPSLIAYRCWSLGVAATGPAQAAFFANLGPVFAALLSAWLLDEPPRWFHAAAFGLIVAGIVISARSRPAQRTAASCSASGHNAGK